jgi:Cytochrome P460
MDSKTYAATGGWGFADFKDGKPADESVRKGCFPCPQLAKDHDLVFARYAP